MKHQDESRLAFDMVDVELGYPEVPQANIRHSPLFDQVHVPDFSLLVKGDGPLLLRFIRTQSAAPGKPSDLLGSCPDQ